VAVVRRNQDTALATLADSAAGMFTVFYFLFILMCFQGQFLQGRDYKGLEARIGEDAPSVLEQGRSGIAKGYQDDHR
jgi:diphthamide biosynthesis protein 2